MWLRKAWVSRTDSALVGSSRSSTWFLKNIARAMATACFCPPERLPTRWWGERIPSMVISFSSTSIARFFISRTFRKPSG